MKDENWKIAAAGAALAVTLVAPLGHAKVCTFWPNPETGYDGPSYKTFTDGSATATRTATAADFTDVAQYNAERYFAELLSEPASVPGYASIATYFAHKMGIMAADDTWKAYDFGWENWGNPDKAMARTLSAFYVAWASYSPGPRDWNDHSGPVLNFALGFMGQTYSSIDDLRGGCSGSSKFAHTQWDFAGIGDEYTVLYPGFFFRANAVRRASTLWHEANHQMGSRGHTAEDAEKEWYSDRPVVSVYGWQAMYLVSYSIDANAHTYKTYRNWAKYAARDILATKIQKTSTIPEALRNF